MALPACCYPSEKAEAPERAYCAYLRSTGGLNYQGLPCPEWDHLPSAIRDAWAAASSEILSGVKTLLPLPPDTAEAICEPVQDPYVGGTVHLPDRNGDTSYPVLVQLNDVILLRHPDDRLSLSRLGVINTLLDQVAPGVRLVARVPDDEGVKSGAVYGLELRGPCLEQP